MSQMLSLLVTGREIEQVQQAQLRQRASWKKQT